MEIMPPCQITKAFAYGGVIWKPGNHLKSLGSRFNLLETPVEGFDFLLLNPLKGLGLGNTPPYDPFSHWLSWGSRMNIAK